MENHHLDYGLFLIYQHLAVGRKSSEEFNLPTPLIEWQPPAENTLIAEELSNDLREQLQDLETMIASLNSEQRRSYNMIMNSLNDEIATQYFLQGPAGTGKTFLYRCLCGILRA
jgi:replication-associated recombination protein RarA